MGLFSFLSGKDPASAPAPATPAAVPPLAPAPAAASSATAVAEPAPHAETPFVRPDAWDAPPDINTTALTAPTEKGTSDGPGVGATDAALTAELQAPIIEVIKTVFDPEIPVDIYELGLIYDISVDADRKVMVKMTLTSPACPSAQQLPSEVRYKVKAVPGVSDATVDIVWEPPWDKDRMSEAARLQLGFF
ncbi:MAG: SUF system Fe-S cluster assembly protein [Acidobacteriota bacterium]